MAKYMLLRQSKLQKKRLYNIILVPVALLVKDNLNARSILRAELYILLQCTNRETTLKNAMSWERKVAND